MLGERRKQLAGTLSGGQQRLLSLAKVLLAPPRLLVADELSLGLAPVVIEQVYDNLRRINAARTALLVVEQQVDRCLEFASKAVVLDHGEVAFEGDSDRTARRSRGSSRPRPSGPMPVPGRWTGATSRRDGTRARRAARCGPSRRAQPKARTNRDSIDVRGEC